MIPIPLIVAIIGAIAALATKKEEKPNKPDVDEDEILHKKIDKRTKALLERQKADWLAEAKAEFDKKIDEKVKPND